MALACTFASLHLRIPSSKAGIRHAFSSRALQRTVCSQRPDLQKSLTSTTYRRHQNAQGHLTLRCMASGKHGQAKDEVATIALGCFWEPDRTFSQQPGVLSTRVGYTGGTSPEPTYQSVCSDDGHTESVQIHFDPQATSYEDLLRVFFKEHNPTIAKGKAQYKSAIWYHSPQQKETAEAMIKQQAEKHGKPVVTDLAPAADWHDAEDYHQKYLSKEECMSAI